MTRFSRLLPDGSETDIRFIPQSAMLRCPHFIMAAEHYRLDNTCRCDDPSHTEMADWGYTWRNGRWECDDE